jgi:hypothetical protein
MFKTQSDNKASTDKKQMSNWNSSLIKIFSVALEREAVQTRQTDLELGRSQL